MSERLSKLKSLGISDEIAEIVLPGIAAREDFDATAAKLAELIKPKEKVIVTVPTPQAKPQTQATGEQAWLDGLKGLQGR